MVQQLLDVVVHRLENREVALGIVALGIVALGTVALANIALGTVALKNTKAVLERVASGSTRSKGGCERVTWNTPTLLSMSNQRGPHSLCGVQSSAPCGSDSQSPPAVASCRSAWTMVDLKES